jgi:hypothetical protein
MGNEPAILHPVTFVIWACGRARRQNREREVGLRGMSVVVLGLFWKSS